MNMMQKTNLQQVNVDYQLQIVKISAAHLVCMMLEFQIKIALLCYRVCSHDHNVYILSIVYSPKYRTQSRKIIVQARNINV